LFDISKYGLIAAWTEARAIEPLVVEGTAFRDRLYVARSERGSRQFGFGDAENSSVAKGDGIYAD
jgi:hypothetical protein